MSSKPQAIKDRICSGRELAESVIEQKTNELKASPSGETLPIGMLRTMLTKHDSCVCRVALRLLEDK